MMGTDPFLWIGIADPFPDLHLLPDHLPILYIFNDIYG